MTKEMRVKQEFLRGTATKPLMWFVRLLKPHVERVDIVGSYRRLAPVMHDVELLVMPNVGDYPRNLFGEPTGLPDNTLFGHLDWLVSNDTWFEEYVDPESGKKTLGNKYRRYVLEGLKLDLFICWPDDTASYGALHAIRTGPADFIKQIVTPREYGGLMPPWMRQKDGRLERMVRASDRTDAGMQWEPVGGIEIDADWFKAICPEMPYFHPQDRTRANLLAWQSTERMAVSSK